MSPLTVAHVVPFVTHRPNGVATSVAGLVTTLRGAGVRAEIWNLTSDVTAPAQRTWGDDALPVFDLPRAGSMLGRLLGRQFAASMAWVRAQRARVDVLHFHGVFNLEAHRIARLGVPYVVTPHGGYNAGALRHKPRSVPQKAALWLLSERAFVERAGVVHLTSATEERGVRALGVRSRTTLVPNGVAVPPAPFARLAPEVGPPYLLFLGRMAVDHKGLDRLLEGYALARRRLGADLPRLVLAGPDHDGGVVALRRLASRLGIADAVLLEPSVQGVAKRRLLAGARAFLHTSRYEGLPFAVLEALAAGVPAILTQGTNLSELAASAGAGWACGDSPDDIATALIVAARTSPETLRAMSERGHALVRERFDRQDMCAQFVRLYEGLAPRSSS